MSARPDPDPLDVQHEAEVAHILPWVDHIYRTTDYQAGFADGQLDGARVWRRFASIAFIGGLLLGATLELLVTGLALR